MSEKPEKTGQIGFGEDGGWLEYTPKEEPPPPPAELPKTEDADSSTFADYEDSPEYNTPKTSVQKIPNAYIIAKFSAYDRQMVVEQGRRMERNGVRGMTETAGPSTVSKVISKGIDKAQQIGF